MKAVPGSSPGLPQTCWSPWCWRRSPRASPRPASSAPSAATARPFGTCARPGRRTNQRRESIDAPSAATLGGNISRHGECASFLCSTVLPESWAYTNKGKTAIPGLAGSVLGRLCRVMGGGGYGRYFPFGHWFEDVRALGFLLPPLGTGP